MVASRPVLLFLVAFFAIGTTAAVATASGWPEQWAPLPVFSVFLYWTTGSWLLAILYGPVLFAVWTWPLVMGRSEIPKRSKALLAVLLGLSALWYVGGWPYRSNIKAWFTRGPLP